MSATSNERLAVFLPTRKGSQRVQNKNTRPFAGFERGLLELKLSQLREVSNADEIILSTNDEESLEFAAEFAKGWDKLKVVARPDHLASSTTNLVDLIAYVPTITDAQHILWTHVTSPFVTGKDYEQAISQYKGSLNEGYDSMMSVKPFKNFLWDKEQRDLINRCTPQRWPQTQDLKDLYEIDSALFIGNRDIYQQKTDRIGDNPFLYQLDKIKSFDIDWEDDFSIAEAIYEKFIR